MALGLGAKAACRVLRNPSFLQLTPLHLISTIHSNTTICGASIVFRYILHRRILLTCCSFTSYYAKTGIPDGLAARCMCHGCQSLSLMPFTPHRNLTCNLKNQCALLNCCCAHIPLLPSISYLCRWLCSTGRQGKASLPSIPALHLAWLEQVQEWWHILVFGAPLGCLPLF